MSRAQSKHHRTHAPPVDGRTVRPAQQHLGRHVERSARQSLMLFDEGGPYRVAVPHPRWRNELGVGIKRGAELLFREAEVAQDDVPLAIDQNVLGLDVTVNNAYRVQTDDRRAEFGHIEVQKLFREGHITVVIVSHARIEIAEVVFLPKSVRAMTTFSGRVLTRTMYRLDSS